MKILWLICRWFAFLLISVSAITFGIAVGVANLSTDSSTCRMATAVGIGSAIVSYITAVTLAIVSKP